MDSSVAPQQIETSGALEMTPEEFRTAGYRLVDSIAEFLESIPRRPVVPTATPASLNKLLPADGLPEHGAPAGELIEEATRLLFENSLLSAHPRFWGYINSSPAPIGALADLLAAAVSPNVGGWILAPMASEIERQTIRWIAELIGYPSDCGGLLVSGGNMANFVPFLAARRAKAIELSWPVHSEGLRSGLPLRVYVSAETHTWIHKAADLFGLGTDSIRWIPVDEDQRMDIGSLRREIERDDAADDLPFLVVGQAGSVSTGAVDPLREIAALCRERHLWFHVDGAYGAVAAVLPKGSREVDPEAMADLRALSEADSVAVDPHKWLYAPLEAGCALVRDRALLRETFSHRPPYYHFDEGDPGDERVNYFEYGFQNSRGFRALKVWLGLRQAGREGCARMVAQNIHVAQALYRAATAHPELETKTQALSITTFRYVPVDLSAQSESPAVAEYLNKLNEELLNRIQRSGEAFLTNAVIGGQFVLRACVVNLHSTAADAEAVAGLVARLGREVDRDLRPAELSVTVGSSVG
ncbi:MAG TPA: aminotransferase class V-fold PLP-dependent enzyme [Terriglobia bacterium]|nr:aminotransferase class V-fold PLP-dependent enzyme [Terriglobia bacterium]